MGQYGDCRDPPWFHVRRGRGRGPGTVAEQPVAKVPLHSSGDATPGSTTGCYGVAFLWCAAHARNRSTGQVLAMRSRSTQPR